MPPSRHQKLKEPSEVPKRSCNSHIPPPNSHYDETIEDFIEFLNKSFPKAKIVYAYCDIIFRSSDSYFSCTCSDNVVCKLQCP
ncbi:hypothetical protein AXF42_Ash012516 [Apostasia shenzhenica]|uniref:Uncharacterized protein n=1 Tax=Apostasia shenzhenica TaxID=1088818 RepID=A0A2I0AR02_9ASPA|nr:hypothetical protein AXF42_Ash012516 [Apostasia shenzhenica]